MATELYGIKDPYQEFWTQHLTPWAATSTPEQKEPEGHLKDVALGLAAAFLAYRLHMNKQLKKRLSGKEITKTTLQVTIATIWKAYLPTWTAKVIPNLVKGYVQGVKEANTGVIPIEILNDVADKYSESLGKNLNDLSAQAVVDGYQAQLNRKVGRKKALDNVLNAYGVTPRTMNTLVNIWTVKEQPSYTNSGVKSIAEARAKHIITADLKTRADVIGGQEAWSAKEHAKQIVWLHALKQGVLPAEATKVWLTKKDEKVCKICGPLHRKEVKIDEKFPGGYWIAPAHVNCRCTAILSMNVKEQALAVAKARGGDKYDRDRRGRFAPAETRTESFVDPNVQRLLDQLKGPAPEEQRIQRIQPIKRVTQLKKIEQIHKPKIAPKLERVPEKIEHPSLQRNKIQRMAQRLTRAQMPSLQKIVEQAPPEMFREDADWLNLPEPLFGLISHHNIDYDSGLAYAGEEVPFFLHESDTGHGKYTQLTTPLSEAIEKHWLESLDQLYDQYSESPNWQTFKDKNGQQWPVDMDTFDAVITDLVNNIPPKQQEVIYLTREVDGREHTTMVRTGDIANQLGIDEEIEFFRPVVIVTFHGRPGVTEIDYSRYGYSTNPGKWRLVKAYEPPDEPISHKPYDIWLATPEDLD